MKYDTYYNTAKSYEHCCMDFRRVDEKADWEWWNSGHNIREYKGRLFFCMNVWQLSNEVGQYVDPKEKEHFVLGSVDPVNGERCIYKDFGIDMKYYWEHSNCNGVHLGGFTVTDNKIYYIYDGDYGADSLRSIDIQTGEETTVYEKIKAFTGAWISFPIIGAGGEFLFATEKLSGNEVIGTYIMNAQTREKVRFDVMLGYNEKYVYYQRGKQTIQLEISSFQELKFSDVFPDKKKKEILFVDCSEDLVFYKEYEDRLLCRTRLFGYNFQNEKVVTFEIPKLPLFGYEYSTLFFTGNRYLLDNQNFNGLAKYDRGYDPIGLAAYDADGNEIGHVWGDRKKIYHMKPTGVITRNFVLFYYGPQNQRWDYFLYAVHFEGKKTPDEPHFQPLFRML